MGLDPAGVDPGADVLAVPPDRGAALFPDPPVRSFSGGQCIQLYHSAGSQSLVRSRGSPEGGLRDQHDRGPGWGMVRIGILPADGGVVPGGGMGDVPGRSSVAPVNTARE